MANSLSGIVGNYCRALSRSPWTLRHAHSRVILVHHARAWWRSAPTWPTLQGRGKARHCPRGGRGDGRCAVWRLVALATVGGDPPIVLSGGGRIKQQEDKHKHWDPTQDWKARYTHTGQPEHTGQKAHAHLCVVALLGGWLLLSLSGGRRESGLPPTFVSVRSVVTDLSTCVAYVSAHLKHTCVKSYHNGTFL